MNGASNAVGKSTMIAGSTLVILLGILKAFTNFTPSSEEIVAATSLLTWGIHWFFPEVDTADSSATAVTLGTPILTAKE